MNRCSPIILWWKWCTVQWQMDFHSRVRRVCPVPNPPRSRMMIQCEWWWRPKLLVCDNDPWMIWMLIHRSHFQMIWLFVPLISEMFLRVIQVKKSSWNSVKFQVNMMSELTLIMQLNDSQCCFLKVFLKWVNWWSSSSSNSQRSSCDSSNTTSTAPKCQWSCAHSKINQPNNTHYSYCRSQWLYLLQKCIWNVLVESDAWLDCIWIEVSFNASTQLDGLCTKFRLIMGSLEIRKNFSSACWGFNPHKEFTCSLYLNAFSS